MSPLMVLATPNQRLCGRAVGMAVRQTRWRKVVLGATHGTGVGGALRTGVGRSVRDSASHDHVGYDVDGAMTFSQWWNLAKRQETREVSILYALSRVRAFMPVVTTGGTVLSHVEISCRKSRVSWRVGWLGPDLSLGSGLRR